MFKNLINRFIYRKKIKKAWNHVKEIALPVHLDKRKIKIYYEGWRSDLIKSLKRK